MGRIFCAFINEMQLIRLHSNFSDSLLAIVGRIKSVKLIEFNKFRIVTFEMVAYQAEKKKQLKNSQPFFLFLDNDELQNFVNEKKNFFSGIIFSFFFFFFLFTRFFSCFWRRRRWWRWLWRRLLTVCIEFPNYGFN